MFVGCKDLLHTLRKAELGLVERVVLGQQQCEYEFGPCV